MGSRDLLVGREQVQSDLDEALGQASTGRGQLVLITGEAGIGKTTMLGHLASSAEARGGRVAWGSCAAQGSSPYAVWRSALGQLGSSGADAARLLEEQQTLDAGDAAASRAAAFDQVGQALVDAGADGLVVVVLDDLHWADPSSIQLLVSVAAQLAGRPILVAAGYRDAEDERGHVDELGAVGASARRIGLATLGHHDTGRMVGQLTGTSPDRAVIADVLRRTAGNPFLVAQLSRLLADGRALSALPPGAREVLADRLAAEPPDVRAVLAQASVLDDPFDPAVLAEVVGVELVAVQRALHHASAARIVEEADGGQWRFVHDLFRQTAELALTWDEQCAAHRCAAAALEARGAKPATIAAHLLAAPDPDGARWALLAAEQALHSLAAEDAARWATRAHAAAPTGPDGAELRTAAQLLEGRSHLLAGRPDDAGAVFTAVAADARAEGDARGAAQAALGFAADLAGFEVRLGDQRQLDLLRQAEADLVPGIDDELRASVLARLSVAVSYDASDDERLRLAEGALALMPEGSAPAARARALAAHCDAIAGPAHVETRLRESTEVVALAEAAGDRALELLGRRLRFAALLESGAFGEAQAEAARFERRAENPLHSWYAVLWRGMWALAEGRIDDALTAAADAAEIGGRAGSVNAPMLGAVLDVEARLVRGDPPDPDEWMAEMGRLFGLEPPIGVRLPQFARLHLALGDLDKVEAALDQFTPAVIDALAVDAEWLPCLYQATNCAVAVHHPISSYLLDRLRPFVGLLAYEGIGAGLHGSVARPVALACSQVGDDDEAVAHARAALEVERGLGSLLAGHAHRALGTVLERRDGPGDAEEAAEAHAAADRRYRTLGLDHLVQGSALSYPEPATTVAPTNDAGAALVREGDAWRADFGGRSTTLRHSKGLADLAVLLSRPGQEVRVTELQPLPAGTPTTDDPALDRQALAEYRTRLAELDADVDAAEAANDSTRAEVARVERDWLLEEVGRSTGLHGRARPAGPDPVERVRKAVGNRIRLAIDRIEPHHAPLARHLRSSVRTGTWCCYEPEVPVRWRITT